MGLLALAGACNTASEGARPAPISYERLDLDQGAHLAAACSGCHGVPGSAISSLQGLPSQALEDRLRYYKSDTDGTSVMHRLARGYSEEQIILVSAYLGSQQDMP